MEMYLTIPQYTQKHARMHMHFLNPLRISADSNRLPLCSLLNKLNLMLKGSHHIPTNIKEIEWSLQNHLCPQDRILL